MPITPNDLRCILEKVEELSAAVPVLLEKHRAVVELMLAGPTVRRVDEYRASSAALRARTRVLARLAITLGVLYRGSVEQQSARVQHLPAACSEGGETD